MCSVPLGVSAGIGLIALAAFLVYLPCLNGRFVMDDDTMLTDNALIQSQNGLYRFWCTTQTMDFWPATNTTFWIEWRLWGNNPGGYHVTSLLLHVLESLLIWLILRRLSVPGAFLAALIFAVHPVNIESAAWIAQRKNITAMLFFLLSIFWYLKAIQRADSQTAPDRLEDNRRETASGFPHPSSLIPHPSSLIPHPSSLIPHPSSFYWLSLAAFVLAMLGKGSAAVLPALVLVITWWLRPLTRRDFLRTAPFFLIAILLTVVNMWFQTHGGEAITRNADFIQRLLGAGGVIWFYLYKAVLPIDLAFVYRQWQIEAGNPLWWIPLLTALAVTAALWIYRKKTWGKGPLCAWAFFCAALVPVMGFTDVGFMKYSLVADHYQHIAIIGVIALATGYWGLWRERMPQKTCWAATTTAVAATCLLAWLAFQQSALYRDPVALYRATLEKNPDCWMAHNNLGGTMAQSGRRQEAREQFELALRLRPDYPEAHNNLGSLLSQTGHLPDAIKHYQEAIRLKPNYPDAHNNLGNALTDLGRMGDAIEQFNLALRLKPDYADAHNNIGVVLVQTGKLSEAIGHFQKALLLRPDYLNALTNSALAYTMLGQRAQAIAAAQKALEIVRASGQTDEARRIEAWLEAYRGGEAVAPANQPASQSSGPAR